MAKKYYARTYVIFCRRQVFEGVDDFVILPGNPDPSNPSRYQQIAGLPVSFDADTGARVPAEDGSGAAVFVLTDGVYFCMIAESEGEAALFDAPEGRLMSMRFGNVT